MFVYAGKKLFCGKELQQTEKDKRLCKKYNEQDRLDALAVLWIESEITVSLNYGSIIQNFADIKVRKKKIH